MVCAMEIPHKKHSHQQTCYELQAIKEYGQSKEKKKMVKLKKVLAVTLGAATCSRKFH